MYQGYIKEAAYQFSNLYLPPVHLLCVSRESWCPKDIWRKLHIHFQISTNLDSAPTPGFSRVSSKYHPWKLRGFWWFLREVLVGFDIMDALRIHQGSLMFRSLPSLEVVQLLCVSRASSNYHPWSLRGCWWFLRGILFFWTDVRRIHKGSCILIFRSLHSWKVV